MNLNRIKRSIKRNLSSLKKDYHIRQIGLFGSYVKGGEQKKSDLDVLVEFEKPIGLFKFIGLEQKLEEITNLKVDLVSKKALKPHIGKHILNEVVYL